MPAESVRIEVNGEIHHIARTRRAAELLMRARAIAWAPMLRGDVASHTLGRDQPLSAPAYPDHDIGCACGTIAFAIFSQMHLDGRLEGMTPGNAFRIGFDSAMRWLRQHPFPTAC